MVEKILYLILITLLPFFELRLSIPVGIGMGLHWSLVFAVCVLTNIILGPLVYFFFDKLIHLFLRFSFIDKLYNKFVIKTQKKINPLVEKYGALGVALFIAIPLPGSGSYAGALGAHLLGLGYKKFIVANTIGVLIAGIVVTLASVGFFAALFAVM